MRQVTRLLPALLLCLILASGGAWGQVTGGSGIPYPVINGECLIGSNGQPVWGSCSGSGTSVTSVTGTAGEITVSPTTGATVVSLPSTITEALTFSGSNAYGTPASITLTNGSGLPISTGVSGLGTGVGTALGNATDAANGLCTVGTSGATCGLLNSANTISGTLTFSGANLALGTNSLTGNFTLTGVPIASGLSNGTPATTLNLDSGNHLIMAALTAGSGITITPSSGAITISATGTGGGSISVSGGGNTTTGVTTLTLGNGLTCSPNGSSTTSTCNLTVTDNTKTTSYPVAAGDMANALNLAGTSGTPALTLPAESSTIFAPGMLTTIDVTGTVNWSLTNSTGLTMTGLNSTTMYPGTSGSFIANANGTGIDFFPGMQVATTSALGGVIPDGATLTLSGATLSCTTATGSQIGCVKPDGSTITISAGVISSVGGAATSIVVGTTTVGNATNPDLLYNNNGTLGNESFATACTNATSAALGCVKVDNATITASSGVISSEGANYYITNAGSTGTTTNKLAKVTGSPASTAVITATTDSPSSTALGIVTAGAGTSGTATIQYSGVATCVFDGATVAGHPVQLSTSTAGDCHDPGSITPSSGQIVGVVLGTIGSAGNAPVALNIPPVNANLVSPHSAAIGWIAGVTPSAGIIATMAAPSTITEIIGRVETAVGSAATVSVYKAPSGTACGSGTNLTSGSFNANGTAATNQILSVTTTALNAGDSLCLQSTGTYYGNNGDGGITVYFTTP